MITGAYTGWRKREEEETKYSGALGIVLKRYPRVGDTINILVNSYVCLHAYAYTYRTVESSRRDLEDDDISCVRDERAARIRIYALSIPAP